MDNPLLIIEKDTGNFVVCYNTFSDIPLIPDLSSILDFSKIRDLFLSLIAAHSFAALCLANLSLAYNKEIHKILLYYRIELSNSPEYGSPEIPFQDFLKNNAPYPNTLDAIYLKTGDHYKYCISFEENVEKANAFFYNTSICYYGEFLEDPPSFLPPSSGIKAIDFCPLVCTIKTFNVLIEEFFKKGFIVVPYNFANFSFEYTNKIPSHIEPYFFRV